MARYLGPKHKICRRVGMKICSNAKCPVTRRAYPPGVHGPTRRKKLTEYATQLLEKQKAKHVYGILERQFKNYYTRATSRTGDTGVYLAQGLERRLDNAVYRMGAAKTRRQARQMVSHGHVRINGKRVDIPSYQVRTGEEVSFSPAPKSTEKRDMQSWITFDPETMTGKIVSEPVVADLPEKLNTRLIIEFYSR
jgi:small subunit ribosomal protein S4